jgi:LysR family transcriptional regulator, transcriptional activator of nhaA
MLGLNYHHLRYFWVVAREGSVARASRAMEVAQPTISGQIRALEVTLNEKLFQRAGRNLVLTEVGTVVYRYAEEIFGLGRELQETLKGHPAGGPMRFVVGVADQLPKLVVRRLLEPAYSLSTPVRVIVRDGPPDRLLADLAIHSLDLVLTDAPVSPTIRVRAFNHPLGECSVTVFGVPRLVSLYQKNFPKSIDGAPFILPSEGSALRRSFEQWCSEQTIHPRIVTEADDSAMIHTLGAAGIGLFAAPSVVEDEVSQQFGVKAIGRIDKVRERFYALSIDRKLKHPAVVAICDAARQDVFG